MAQAVYQGSGSLEFWPKLWLRVLAISALTGFGWVLLTQSAFRWDHAYLSQLEDPTAELDAERDRIPIISQRSSAPPSTALPSTPAPPSSGQASQQPAPSSPTEPNDAKATPAAPKAEAKAPSGSGSAAPDGSGQAQTQRRSSIARPAPLPAAPLVFPLPGEDPQSFVASSIDPDLLATVPPMNLTPPVRPSLPTEEPGAIATTPIDPSQLAVVPPATIAPPQRPALPTEGGLSAGSPPTVATVPTLPSPGLPTQPSPPTTSRPPTTAQPPSRPNVPATPTPSNPPPVATVPIPVTPPDAATPPDRSTPTTPPDQTAAIPTPAAPPPNSIFVEQFEVLGNTVFSAEELVETALAAITPESETQTADLSSSQIGHSSVFRIERYLTLADLVQASEAITQLYVDAGYISSGAFIPRESVEGGRPVIQVVEGRLEDINIAFITPESIAVEPVPDNLRPTSLQPLSRPVPKPELIVDDSGLDEAELNRLAVTSRAEDFGTLESVGYGDSLTNRILAAVPQDPEPASATPAEGNAIFLPIAPKILGFGPEVQSLALAEWLDPAWGHRQYEVTGIHPLDPAYLISRLAIAGSAPLNINRLVEGVQLLQIDPLIAQISTEIAAGTQTGTSVLNVSTTQALDSGVSFSMDNNRSPAVGSIRQTARIHQGNFLGLGDEVNFSVNRTDGSVGWDVDYTVPVSPYNTTLRFAAGRTESRVIDAFFSFLDIQSQSGYFELTLRHPFIQTPSEEFALSLTASRRESFSEFLASSTGGGIPFPTTGAGTDGTTKISSVRFTQDWTRREAEQVFALQSEFTLGVGAFNATINDDPPDSRFFAWKGSAQWVRLLAPDTLFLLQGSVQLSNNPLVPSEQFSLGGQNTVRGYRQDTLLTDNGLRASAELQLPLFRIPEIDTLFQIAPFFDIGYGWNNPISDPPTQSTLAGMGLGLVWRQGDSFTARLDWGMPLSYVSYDRDTWQEAGVYFNITFTP